MRNRPPLQSPSAATALRYPQPRVPARSDTSELARPRAARADARSPAALDFEHVYATHFHEVCRWARALGGLDADLDDLAQEVFLVVRRKLDEYRGPSLPAWLYGITRKTVSDYRRRAWLRRVLGGVTRSLQDSPPQADPRQSGAHERWEARQLLAQVLERMSARRRTAFVLFEIEGYSGAEIAELEQIPVATVHTRLHHARKDFVRLVAELEGEQGAGGEP